MLERIKPERDQNNRDTYKKNWWVFGEPRKDFRPSLLNLSRYIATVETAKHRVFVFLPATVIPDNKLLCIASDDAYIAGILSSRIHVIWSLAAGGRLGQGNDPVYVKTRCFDPFPFPDCPETARQRIRDIAERIDAHRWRQKAQYPELTLTGMYNVLATVKAGRTLNEEERVLNQQGLISVLADLHHQLDGAVADAYGWPADLGDEAVLERVVALNHHRAAEEAAGLVRWLRPDYQAPDAIAAVQTTLDMGIAAPLITKAGRRPWPKALPDQVGALKAALTAHPQPIHAEELARLFIRARRDRVAEVLRTMADLGQIRDVDGHRYAAL